MVALAPSGELAVVAIGDFRTEAGATLTDAHIAYQRFGDFRGDRHTNNVILIEHALTGDTDVTTWWDGLVGPGLALDTNRWCVICTNALGGCYGSTGPASAHPDGAAWGSRFPALSIRDLVAAERDFLHSVGIGHVRAVIGGSMGGARALEWTLSWPTFVDAACVLAVSARASAWQIGIQSAQISAITRDPDFHGGDYYSICDGPLEGLAAARRIAHLTYRGEMELDERFGTIAQQGENPLGKFRDPAHRFAVESYLEYQGRKLVERFDAGTYVVLTEALNRHDAGRGRGGLNKALYSSTVPTLVAGVDTDILYPFHQQEHLSRNLGNVLGLYKIVSPVGHDAFLTETRQLDRILRMFIAKTNDGAEPTDGFGLDPEGQWII
ncbi:homoserine O-acetyltransferase MetX [Corynebacterium uterequi]|uniref:Homoserine O-acetyltransferase n=1 Tax=Corynebacterium uterequi TaxID=1072256 RepID=A0A0G3HES2_9CORY|nr:homoserine O-acetyltransferase [Corynebacterium uterequi]AKK10473.1 homoserine O-acetyltransferase [Corynebacterium uterequi]